MRLRHLFVFAASVSFGLATACGGGNKDSATAKAAEAIDADPIALFPSAAMAISRVDAKQMFTSGSVGGQLALMAERMLPIGEEAGFKASRDLETIYAAGYSTSGADVVAILRGTFDEQKIKSVADSHTPTKGGGVLVASTYLGRQVYTLSNVGFTVISKQTVVAGSETMIRRVIERMKDGTVQRSQPPWMVQTIETPSAAFAAAADFANQPVASASIGMVPLGWVQGMKAARVIGNFKDPGLNIAGTLTFPDKAAAADAAEQVKRTAGMASLLQFIGAPQLKNLEVKPVEGDVQVSFGVDDSQLKTFLQTAQSYLPAAAR
jgi:hypothetical protein